MTFEISDELEETLNELFNKEIAHELLNEKFSSIDEVLFEDAFIRCKGNCWDTAIVYELMLLAKEIKV